MIHLEAEHVSHPKIRGLSADAYRLWIWVLAWCDAHDTDGFIPREDAEALAYKAATVDRHPDRRVEFAAYYLLELHHDAGIYQRATQRLSKVTLGPPPWLFERPKPALGAVPDSEGEQFEHWLLEPVADGFRVHDWADHNATADAKAQSRAHAAKRAKRYRARKKERDADEKNESHAPRHAVTQGGEA